MNVHIFLGTSIKDLVAIDEEDIRTLQIEAQNIVTQRKAEEVQNLSCRFIYTILHILNAHIDRKRICGIYGMQKRKKIKLPRFQTQMVICIEFNICVHAVVTRH